MRAVLALILFGLLASPASAWDWAPSPAGHLAFVTEDDEGSATLRVVSPDGVVGPSETIDGATPAVGARGDVLLAWFDGKQLWARYRPPGGPVGPPELVASHVADMEALPLALDDTGHALIVWKRRDGLHVRERDPAAGWGAEQTIPVRFAFRAKLALAGNGQAALAWLQEGPSGPNSMQVAVSRRAPGGAFGAPRVVAGVQRHPGGAVVAANARGDYAVAWVELHHNTLSVHASFNGGAPVAMSHDDASGPAVDVEPDGRTLVAWRSHGNHRNEAWNGTRHILTRHAQTDSAPVILPGGVIVWLEANDVIRAGDLHVTQTIGRGSVPAFAAGPAALTVVADPPQQPDDPIAVRRVPLPLQGE